jgi:5-methylcytosine-specific restriction endonuclease McrA
LSDNELLAQIEKIRRREHLSTIEILLHLNEVERRKLHLKLSYSSLYDYCVRHLRYSSSGASRRVAVARCIRQHPEALDLLRSHKLNVTGVSLVASVLREDNKTEILEDIQNKSQSEIDAIAARYRPAIALRDRVKPVRVAVPGSRIEGGGRAETRPPASLQSACKKSNFAHNGQSGSLTDCKETRKESGNSAAVRTEQKLLIQFLANRGFMERYEEVRALLSQRLPDTSFEAVFEALINEFLERHSPVRRKARRERKKTARTKPRPEPASQEPKRHTRQIPAAVREKVFVRDKGRCTYVGRTGKRCGSTQALQIDHIEPFARGGSNRASNLRLLCAKHNRLVAEEIFGEALAARFRPRE